MKKRGSDTKFLATVLAIGTECDIAMLTVEDDSFWEGVQPLEFGSLPRLQVRASPSFLTGVCKTKRVGSSCTSTWSAAGMKCCQSIRAGGSLHFANNSDGWVAYWHVFSLSEAPLWVVEISLKSSVSVCPSGALLEHW